MPLSRVGCDAACLYFVANDLIVMQIDLISLHAGFIVLRPFHCDTTRFRFVAVQLHCDAEKYVLVN